MKKLLLYLFTVCSIVTVKAETADYSNAKMVDHNRRNRASTISAMTGGKVTLSDKVNYKGNNDFLETDYHE